MTVAMIYGDFGFGSISLGHFSLTPETDRPPRKRGRPHGNQQPHSNSSSQLPVTRLIRRRPDSAVPCNNNNFIGPRVVDVTHDEVSEHRICTYTPPVPPPLTCPLPRERGPANISKSSGPHLQSRASQTIPSRRRHPTLSSRQSIAPLPRR